jgi:hypothetical protein
LEKSSPSDIKKFVEDLGEAIKQDMAEIRETELDSTGGYEKVVLRNKSGTSTKETLWVDALGRVLLPMDTFCVPDLAFVTVGPKEDVKHAVVRTEVRFLGERPVAKVLYLDKEEIHV